MCSIFSIETAKWSSSCFKLQLKHSLDRSPTTQIVKIRSRNTLILCVSKTGEQLNWVKNTFQFLSAAFKRDVCTSTGVTHRSCRRPSQLMRVQVAECVRCATVCLSRSPLKVTQPSRHCSVCENQRHLKTPSYQEKHTHTHFPNFTINNIEAPKTIITQPPQLSLLREAGGISRLWRRKADVVCSSWQLQVREGRRDAFSSIWRLCAIWPKDFSTSWKRYEIEMLHIMQTGKTEQNAVCLNTDCTLCIDFL